MVEILMVEPASFTAEAELPTEMGQDLSMHPRAGTIALEEDLIDIDEVISQYYDRVPDPQDPAQQVVFGTSGHREIGRASCRERVSISVGGVSLEKKERRRDGERARTEGV